MGDEKTSRFFAFHTFIFRYFGVGYYHFPDEDSFENYPSKTYTLYCIFCMICNVSFYTASEISFSYFAIINDRNINRIFLAVNLAGIHVIGILKIYLLIKNNRKIQKIIKFLEVDSKNFGYDQDIINYSNTFTKIVTGGFFIPAQFTIGGMSLLTAFLDMKRSDKLIASNYTLDIPRDTPFAAYVPWEFDTNLKYSIGFVYASLGLWCIATIVLNTDTFIASLMVHISGQFKICQKVIRESGLTALVRLENRMGIQTTEKNDIVGTKEEVKRIIYEGFSNRKEALMAHFTEEDFNRAMGDILKEAIQYHQHIIEIVDDLQEAYGNGFLGQTFISLYAIGLTMIQSALTDSNMDRLNIIFFLITMISQLFIQTYSANEINLEAENIYMSAYSCHWYSSDKKTANLLALIMHRAQKPVNIVAGRIFIFSNKLFMTIMKTSYQIFTVISTSVKQ